MTDLSSEEDPIPAEPYVVTYAPRRRLVGLIVLWAVMGTGVFGLAAFVAYPRGDEVDVTALVVAAIQLPLVALFWTGAARFARAARRRDLALSVDRAGVTLGRFPFPPAREVRVPWHDVAEVIVYHSSERRGKVVALRLREGATRPPGAPAPGSLRARLRLRPGDVDRVVRGWRLDRHALFLAMREYAPSNVELNEPSLWDVVDQVHAEIEAEEAAAARARP